MYKRDATGNNGRINGRFAKGNTYSKGPRRTSSVAKYKKWIDAAMKRVDWEICFLAVVRKAQAGDIAANRLILEYMVGPPAVGAAEHVALLNGILEKVKVLEEKRRR